MGKGQRQKINQDEHDVVTGWHKLLCLARGTTKKVKQRLNRRERRKTKEMLQSQNNKEDNL